MSQSSAPYQGPDRRAERVNPQRIDAIETRQAAMLSDIKDVKDELSRNTAVTNRMAEILEAPATFWAWCSRWGKRISLFAKYTAPVVALLVACDQLLHIDIATLLKRIFFK